MAAKTMPFLVQLVKSHWTRKYKLGSQVVDTTNERKYRTQALFDQISDSDDNSAGICVNHVDSPRKYAAREDRYFNFQANCLQHGSKNWQQKRKYKLTASTFAFTIGFWPKRRIQLWEEKIGAKEPFSGNLATYWSNIRERKALEQYMEITGNRLLLTEFQVYGKSNSDDDWLAASPDGIVVDSKLMASPGLLEVKCPFFNGEMEGACPWKRIPHYYIPQAQGLMEILDKDWMDFYCWTCNGSSLFRIYRDPEYWKMMKMALNDFWWKHVLPAREIYQRYETKKQLQQLSSHQQEQIRSFEPAPVHDLFQHIVIKSKCIVDASPLRLMAFPQP